MSDREIIARFNSLLAAGLSIDQATEAAEPSKLSGQFSLHYRYLLRVCQEAGGSPVTALQNLERIAQQHCENEARLRISSTVPKATARLVLWLPLGAVALGQLLGLGSLEVFFNSVAALVGLLLGLMMLVAAQGWTNRILSTANRPEDLEEILLDAIALSVDAGISHFQAVQICGEGFAEIYEREPSQAIKTEMQELLEFSELHGSPIAHLFRNRAQEIRSRNANHQGELLERVSIRLLAPIAIFVLPAFVLIAVLPISVSLITNN